MLAAGRGDRPDGLAPRHLDHRHRDRHPIPKRLLEPFHNRRCLRPGSGRRPVRSSSIGYTNTCAAKLMSERSRASWASAAARPPPALAPATATRDVSTDGSLTSPLQCFIAVVQRGRVRVVGGKTVVDRSYGDTEFANYPPAQPVVHARVAEDIPAAMDPQQRPVQLPVLLRGADEREHGRPTAEPRYRRRVCGLRRAVWATAETSWPSSVSRGCAAGRAQYGATPDGKGLRHRAAPTQDGPPVFPPGYGSSDGASHRVFCARPPRRY